jgi:rhodanese-related sulfurtransferase
VKILLAAILCGGLILAASRHTEPASADSLADLSASVRARFPDVPTLSPAELARWMNDPTRTPPILLEVREEKEFAVSRLPGARRAETDAVAQLRQLGASVDTPVVVYCSVGYRSSVLAQKLRKGGFSNVHNLEGSIFLWANENRPLVNAGGAAKGTHPYDGVWGRYLDKSEWRWKPDPAPSP